jgi:hypothetical protein
VDIIVDEEPSSSEVVMASTSCWRGYIGTWEIVEDKLYLIELKGYPGNNKRFTMNSLFPNQERVYAEWYSGEIKIPQGKMLHYEHMGYMSLFEKDLFLEFNKGMLVGSREVDNTKTFDPKDPYGMKEFAEGMAKDFYDKQNKGKASKP